MSLESARKEDIQVGDKMPDGTIYAGISPDTGKAMYATPKDAPLTYTFKQAQKYEREFNHLEELAQNYGEKPASHHTDWRVPTKGELNVLWENRDKGALKGTFNETGSYKDGWYWSSSPNRLLSAWMQRFTDGHQLSNSRIFFSSLRCVRG